jgi:thymidylate kinase
MESRPLDYHRRVRDLFRNLPDEYPGRVEIVDGLGNPQEVHQRIMEILERVDF